MQNLYPLHLKLPEEAPETDEDMTPIDGPEIIPYNDLKKVGGEIEHGSFGIIKMGLWKRTPVAIKFQKDYAFAKKEAELHHKLSHPNIVLLLAVSKTPEYFCMILERMDDDLLENITTHPDFNLEKKINIAKQITSGIKYLHDEAKVLHRDIKMENILISGTNIKIADFGLSVPISAKERSHSGCLLGNWQAYAPELINREALFTPQTDIYALAILLYELVCSHRPYATLRSQNNASINNTLGKIKEGMRPTFVCTNPLNPIITKAWAQDAGERPLASELLRLLLTVSMEPRHQENQIPEAQKELARKCKQFPQLLNKMEEARPAPFSITR